MQHQVTIIYAFLAGLLSFLSPCVLPLVPGYVSLLSGTASQTGGEEQKTSALLVQNSLLFILGFSVVFISLGAAASSVGQTLRTHQTLLSQISGIVVILFGLHLLGVIRIKALYADKRVRTNTISASGAGAFLVGFAFAFGWTPCIGPVLGTILLLAASEKTLVEGIFLLTVYSVGLAVPFLLTTLALDRFTNFYRGFRRHLHTVELISGGLMVLIGVLLLTHRFSLISGYLTKVPLFNKLLL